MLIQVSRLADFEGLTDSLIQNGITDVRIFFSRKKVGRSITTLDDSSTPNTMFSYVLCSPIYHVAYTGSCPNAEFEKIDEAFDEYRRSRGDVLRVQEFESLWFEKGSEILHLENLVKVY